MFCATADAVFCYLASAKFEVPGISRSAKARKASKAIGGERIGRELLDDFLKKWTRELVSLGGLNQTQSSVRPDKCSGGTNITSSVAFGREIRNRCNEEFYGTGAGLRTLVKHGKLHEAIRILDLMAEKDVQVCSDLYMCLLQGCIHREALAEGKHVHACIIKSGGKADIFLATTLIHMYAKCSCMLDARQVFDNLPERNVVSWTAIITGYTQHEDGEEALRLFWQMQWEGEKPDEVTFASALKACACLGAFEEGKALEEGKVIHAHIIKSGIEPNIFMGNALADMYAKCGTLENACLVFDKMPKRDLVSWNTMISGYAKHGLACEAFQLSQEMEQEGIAPDEITIANILKACAMVGALYEGRHIHAWIVDCGIEPNIFLWNALLDTYTKCCGVKDALKVFETMSKQTVVSWTTMIAGYARHGQVEEALNLFWQMEGGSIKPNKVTFLSVLDACTTLAAFEQGKQIHACIIKSGLESTVSVGSSVISMYIKCGSTEDAYRVFLKMPTQNVISWTAMIAGCVKHVQVEEALYLLSQMECEGVKPNEVTFVSIINACATISALEQGRQIHAQVVKYGFDLDVFVGSSLVNMYAKCGSLDDALLILNQLPEKDEASWTAMISSYTQQGHPEEAVKLFWQMELEGVKVDQVTLVSVLKAFASLGSPKVVKQIHSCLIESELELDISVANTLIMIYSHYSNMADAWQVFHKISERNVILWNGILAGCAQQGYGHHALRLYHQMQEENVPPNNLTFITVLNACASVSSLEQGRQIHSHIIKCKLESNVFVGSSIVDMYVKCKKLVEARQVFDEVPVRDAVLLNTMIAGYVQHGLPDDAVDLYQQTQWELLNPNEATFVSILNACANLSSFDLGRKFHVHAKKSGFESDVVVGSALVNMYAKCGSIKDACQMFTKMSKLDLVSWNVMIAAHAQHGNGKAAFEILGKMEQEGSKFDHVTFISILSACSYVGLVSDGYHFFDCMTQVYKIMPTMEHYACMVDLLGRAGCLEEAEDFVRELPVEPSAVVWRALLGACRIHGNMELAKHAAESLHELEPQNASAFIMLSGNYSFISDYDD